MLVVIVGLLLFLGIHSVIIFAPAVRENLIDNHGPQKWKLIFTVISLVGLALIVWGFGLARQNPVFIYQPPLWASGISALLMVFAMIFFASSSLHGRISQKIKHPQLTAVKTWAVAHLLANGDLGSVLLFGSFLAWAVLSRISIKKRVAAGLASDNLGGPLRNDIMAIGAGVAVYAIFVFWAHQFLFGVSPINH